MLRLLLRLYGFLFCLFFTLIVTAQVLSFLGLYRALFVFPLSILVWAGACWLYFRADNGWLAQTFPPDEAAPSAGTLRKTLYFVAAGLLISVFLMRMVLFPNSSIGSNLPSDATGYHFVKAIELVRTGTMWDLSILYGEYPVGYESLISIGVMLAGNVYLAGTIHALNLLLLVLTLGLLLRRYTRLPLEVCLFLSVILFFYPALYSQTLLIGKNDLVLSMLILAAVLHSPLAVRDRPDGLHPFGLALATCMAMSLKPGGYLTLGFIWLVVLVQWVSAYRQGNASRYLPPRLFIAAVAVMMPCGLWVIRNFAIMGRLVSPEVASFFQGSIFNSLRDPMLYTAGSESITLIGLSAWTLLLAGVVYLSRRFYPPVVLLLPVMYLAFITTPLSAFHTTARQAVHIEWRYTTHSFLYMAVLCIALAVPLILRLYRMAQRRQTLVSVMLVAGGAAVIAAIGPADLFGYHPDQAQHLSDPYLEPAGEYRSVYDYVRREIHDSTIIGIHASPYYMYMPPYTNRIVEMAPQPIGMPDLLPRPVPDYLVYLRQSALYPAEATLMPPYHWTIVYEDSGGIVYRRERD